MYDYHEVAPRTMSTGGVPRGPSWLRELIGSDYFDRAVWVNLFQTPANDEWESAVNNLPSTRYLLLSGANVSDKSVKQLAGGSSLVELSLARTKVTDQSMKELAKFPNLRWLVLDHTGIGDRGAANVELLVHLEELNVSSTKLSDASIEQIGALKSLRILNLRATQVSSEGVARLTEMLPNCKIITK